MVRVPKSLEADHVTADLSPTFHSPTRLCFDPEVLQRGHTHIHTPWPSSRFKSAEASRPRRLEVLLLRM